MTQIIEAAYESAVSGRVVPLVGLALGQLLVGPRGDRIGRRTPLLLGSLGFLLASIACALAPSIEFFIAARFMQGFAGAAGLVMARAVVGT